MKNKAIIAIATILAVIASSSCGRRQKEAENSLKDLDSSELMMLADSLIQSIETWKIDEAAGVVYNDIRYTVAEGTENQHDDFLRVRILTDKTNPELFNGVLVSFPKGAVSDFMVVLLNYNKKGEIDYSDPCIPLSDKVFAEGELGAGQPATLSFTSDFFEQMMNHDVLFLCYRSDAGKLESTTLRLAKLHEQLETKD